MYARYFGFSDAPFSIAPDPRFLYLSAHHREALAHLLYGVEQGGFVVLTGEVGTGKTTVCRCLLQQLPQHVDVAFIINPRQTVTELLQSILAELGLDLGGDITSNKLLVDLLNERLLEGHAQGRNTILIVDEAQNLAPEVLEQLRLLTNLETNERKLLQLILLGQPELNELLDSQQLRQLAQRVTARYHLSALAPADVREYVQHRLAVAGFRGELFSRAALRQIAHRSRGIPRLINLICDRALLGVYAASGQQVDRGIVNRAADEVLPRSRFRPYRWLGAGLGVLLLASGLAGWAYFESLPATPPASSVQLKPETTRGAARPVSLDASDPYPGVAALTPLDPELARQLPLSEGDTLPTGLLQAVAQLPELAGMDHYPGYHRSVLYEQQPPPGLAGALFEQLVVLTRDGPAQQITPGITELVRRFQSQRGLAVDGELNEPTVLHLLTLYRAEPSQRSY